MVSGNTQAYKQEFIAVVKEEIALNRELLGLFDDEKAVLTKSKHCAKDLSAVTQKKEACFEKLSKTIQERRLLCVSIATAYDIKIKDICMSFLAQRWNDPSVAALRDEYRQLVEAIRVKQEQNAGLLMSGLELVQTCIYTFTRDPHQSTYGRKGDINESANIPQNFVDKKI